MPTGRRPRTPGAREGRLALPRPSASPRQARARPHDPPPVQIAGVAITHPEKILYADLGLTKLDLARYYDAISSWMLPHVVGRPLTLVRCGEGIPGDCEFMRHSRVWGPWPLKRVLIPEKTKVGEYLVIESASSLAALVQMDILEIHTWNTRSGNVEHPDRLVIDLDPGPEVRWSEVVDAAFLVREALAALKLESFVKTTGGVGLHLVVPIVPERDWSECLDFTRSFAEAMSRHDPKRFTAALPKAGREKKILLDYLRNNRTNTSVAAFSTRARAHAPVSTPISWDELGHDLRPAEFNVRTVPKRLAALRRDPWHRHWRLRQRIPPEAGAALSMIAPGPFVGR